MGSDSDLEPVENIHLAATVRQVAAGLGLVDTDAAAKQLAVLYARAIDSAEDSAGALDVFGPKLLQVLTALGATPAARAKTAPKGQTGGKLANFRQSA